MVRALVVRLLALLLHGLTPRAFMVDVVAFDDAVEREGFVAEVAAVSGAGEEAGGGGDGGCDGGEEEDG